MKPYRYSRKAKRYIPTSKKSSRSFYHKKLTKLTGCNFDPHSTFGKFIMRKLISKLRKHRKCEEKISKYESEIAQKRANFYKLLDNYKSRVKKSYQNEITGISKRYAHKEKSYLKYLDYIPIILSIGIFILLVFHIGGIAFLPSLIIYLVILSVAESHSNKVIKSYTNVAESKYNGKMPSEQVYNFKSTKRKEINDLLESLKPAKINLREIENTIENKLNTIFSEDRIRFILSDQFYTSTDWISIRDEVLESEPNVCVKCGSKNDLTVDHIKPRSKRPRLALKKSNTQILCRSCNSSKGNKVNW